MIYTLPFPLTEFQRYFAKSRPVENIGLRSTQFLTRARIFQGLENCHAARALAPMGRS